MGADGSDFHTQAAILAALPDPIVAIDGDGRLAFANLAAQDCLRDRTALFADLGALCDRVRSEGQPQSAVIGGEWEWRARPAGGGLVVASPRSVPADLAAELAAIQDDNRALLQEIHHRVKNSLQVVSAMLRMQSWRLGDSPMRWPFEEACSRILTLASVHEVLYRQGSPGAVDFAAILAPLVEGLARQREDGRPLPTVTIGGGKLLLTIDRAIPAALIVQEWLSVARGAVSITLSPGGPIVVSGLAGLDPASLGARMVAVLVAQLRGRVEVLSGPPGGLALHLKQQDFGAMAGSGQETAEIGAGDGGGHVVA
ncbi:hypothetical protein MTBLM5_90090 [Magnetospirillum sp. LM-5]|uniref:sensor histidine kinase n=1 Tax=Magnetospirillum sp. LM-5 TaxID=2681466 RepID=UPI00137E7CE7|nr:histidine kinase dimerization/phosphoacceptor domain -containing protein [Magnetospirillum sp. LM-5]CAA7625953.1 hypothetical protein MTBLM5_90090 [Magnetospirillum sp. LM-5]